MRFSIHLRQLIHQILLILLYFFCHTDKARFFNPADYKHLLGIYYNVLKR